jgi:hypothetical protein
MKTKLLTFESNERQQSQDGTELKWSSKDICMICESRVKKQCSW